MVLSNYKHMYILHIRVQGSWDPDPRFTSLFQYIPVIPVHSSNVSSNRIKIQEILLILQLETDYFSKLFISESAPFEAVAFQKCYSTRRSLTGFFSSSSNSSSNYNSNSTRVPIHHTRSELHPSTYTYTCTSREFSIQNTILHAEDKELFEYYYYYYTTDSRNSTHRRQGDLLEMHPCVLQDLPVTFQASSHKSLQRQTPVTPIAPDIPVFPVFPDIPVVPDTPKTFRTFQSFMTFQPFQAILQILHCSSISRDSTPFQHSPTRMHILQFLQILQFDWFPQKLHRVPVEQYKLQTFYRHYILQRKGDVVISVKRASVKMSRWHIIQNRINSLFRLSSDNTNYNNVI